MDAITTTAPGRLTTRPRLGILAAVALAFAALLAASLSGRHLSKDAVSPAPAPDSQRAPAGATGGVLSPKLAALAQRDPAHQVRVIVQLRPGAARQDGLGLLRAAGATDRVRVPLISAVAGTLRADRAAALAADPRVRAVSLDAAVRRQSVRPGLLLAGLLGYPSAVRAPGAWARGATGDGVTVAVIDSGIAGDLPDLRDATGASRVRASAVVNAGATEATDRFGHGTHVAGIIAGNSLRRPRRDTRSARYMGIAPDADLVSVKVSDDQGEASVLDVIHGLEFVVDHRADLGIRVINLSLQSTEAQSARTDPLDAAVEAAWLKGLVVVAAAGNRGDAPDAVGYAPGNDPYVITVGALDDVGTRSTADDIVASWSSRGTTEDGVAKPDVYAPGTHIMSLLAPGSAFAQMCPSCIEGDYIRAGGTSMAAPVVAGVVADMLERHPEWTPDQVKAVLLETTARTGPGALPLVQADAAVARRGPVAPANQGLTPNELIDPATGAIDATRSSWGRSSWGVAAGGLVAGWARSSWSCACGGGGSSGAEATRSSWGRSSWSVRWER